MKKRFVVFISRFVMFTGLMLCLASCGKQPAAPEPSEKTDSKVTEVIEMTEHEKELLCAVFPMEERIREGRLLDYQELALYEYREGMQYLEDKYPGYEFESLSLTPATKFDPWMTVRIQSTGTEVREVRITPESSGVNTCSDTVYNEVLGERYDAALENIFLYAGIDAKTCTEFPSPRTDIGPETEIDEILYSSLPRMTHIFVSKNGGDGELSEAVQEVVSGNHIYGNYILYFTEGGPDTIEDMEAERLSMENEAFSFFDR